MSTLRDALPDDLLRTALKAETSEKRALAVHAIGRTVRNFNFTEADRVFAARLFDHISSDVSEEVRRALAVTLRLSPNLPRAIANRLICDLDSIAVPILSGSPVITDVDLIAILQSRAASKIRAIAERSHLSERVSHAVISTGDVPAIVSLAANDHALISPADSERLIRLGEHVDLIGEAALRRQDLPMALAVRLIDRQVDSVDEKLSRHDAMAEHGDAKERIVAHTRERTQSAYAGRDWPADTLREYVAALAARNRLTEDVIARAAGQGDWRFVQLALAQCAGISAAKAGLMAFDPIPYPMTVLCTRAGLGIAAQTLLRVSSEAYRDLERSSARLNRRDFQRLMTERIATHPDAPLYEMQWMDWLDDGLTPKLA